ncbi:MAG: glutamate 5-kinase [Oscillospiraceae bacterium]|jgi:glutamate 5-kinase|nr:glutamate 5-kinase [Oscillospiraceae bacterium]
MNRKRVVFKVGTSTLCHGGRGLNFRNIDGIARALSDIRNEGYDVILVSSGAIGAGVGKLNLTERPSELRAKQAVAAVGQCELVHIYDKFFGEYGITIGQILLTRADISRAASRANLVGTFEALLGMGIIPIVNENDSVAFEEIESEQKVFGDNDTLSAVVAGLVSAEKLVLLSDIDGLYDHDPNKSENASLIPVVTEITSEIISLAGGAGSALGTGGMATKIQAAIEGAKYGIETVIVNGSRIADIYAAVHGGSSGTRFCLAVPQH